MDELSEVSGRTLEILRQPLEEKKIIISRVSGNYCFPAAFLFVGAMNGCPCGGYPDMNRCSCTPGDILRYRRKVSRPLLERMDLCVVMRRVRYKELIDESADSETSEVMRRKVMGAWELQKQRYENEKFEFNSEIPSAHLRKFCRPDREGEELLQQAFRTLQLSVRGYHRLLRTARTIADIEGSEIVRAEHIGEAVGFKAADLDFWKL